MKSIMKRRELNIGNIVQVGYNQVRVVRDEKVSCDGCYFRPICAKDYKGTGKVVGYIDGGFFRKDKFLIVDKETKKFMKVKVSDCEILEY